MSLRFKLETPDNHIIVIDKRGRQLLLDTGSPVTLGDVRPDWLGVESPIRRSRPSFDFEALSGFVGGRVDGLVGIDVLAQVPFLIDWEAKIVEFQRGAPPTGSVDRPVDLSARVPVVEFEVAGRQVRGLIDTGAIPSFFSVQPEGLSLPFGHRSEFVPGRLDKSGRVKLEEFETPLWKLPVVFGRPFEATFGRLPSRDGPSPRNAEGVWILGSDLWRNHLVQFDLPRRRIFVGGRVDGRGPAENPA